MADPIPLCVDNGSIIRGLKGVAASRGKDGHHQVFSVTLDPSDKHIFIHSSLVNSDSFSLIEVYSSSSPSSPICSQTVSGVVEDIVSIPNSQSLAILSNITSGSGSSSRSWSQIHLLSLPMAGAVLATITLRGLPAGATAYRLIFPTATSASIYDHDPSAIHPVKGEQASSSSSPPPLHFYIGTDQGRLYTGSIDRISVYELFIKDQCTTPSTRTKDGHENATLSCINSSMFHGANMIVRLTRGAAEDEADVIQQQYPAHQVEITCLAQLGDRMRPALAVGFNCGAVALFSLQTNTMIASCFAAALSPVKSIRYSELLDGSQWGYLFVVSQTADAPARVSLFMVDYKKRGSLPLHFKTEFTSRYPLDQHATFLCDSVLTEIERQDFPPVYKRTKFVTAWSVASSSSSSSSSSKYTPMFVVFDPERLELNLDEWIFSITFDDDQGGRKAITSPHPFTIGHFNPKSILTVDDSSSAPSPHLSGTALIHSFSSVLHLKFSHPSRKALASLCARSTPSQLQELLFGSKLDLTYKTLIFELNLFGHFDEDHFSLPLVPPSSASAPSSEDKSSALLDCFIHHNTASCVLSLAARSSSTADFLSSYVRSRATAVRSQLSSLDYQDHKSSQIKLSHLSRFASTLSSLALALSLEQEYQQLVNVPHYCTALAYLLSHEFARLLFVDKALGSLANAFYQEKRLSVLSSVKTQSRSSSSSFSASASQFNVYAQLRRAHLVPADLFDNPIHSSSSSSSSSCPLVVQQALSVAAPSFAYNCEEWKTLADVCQLLSQPFSPSAVASASKREAQNLRMSILLYHFHDLQAVDADLVHRAALQSAMQGLANTLSCPPEYVALARLMHRIDYPSFYIDIGENGEEQEWTLAQQRQFARDYFTCLEACCCPPFIIHSAIRFALESGGPTTARKLAQELCLGSPGLSDVPLTMTVLASNGLWMDALTHARSLRSLAPLSSIIIQSSNSLAMPKGKEAMYDPLLWLLFDWSLLQSATTTTPSSSPSSLHILLQTPLDTYEQSQLISCLQFIISTHSSCGPVVDALARRRKSLVATRVLEAITSNTHLSLENLIGDDEMLDDSSASASHQDQSIVTSSSSSSSMMDDSCDHDAPQAPNLTASGFVRIGRKLKRLLGNESSSTGMSSMAAGSSALPALPSVPSMVTPTRTRPVDGYNNAASLAVTGIQKILFLTSPLSGAAVSPIPSLQHQQENELRASSALPPFYSSSSSSPPSASPALAPSRQRVSASVAPLTLDLLRSPVTPLRQHHRSSFASASASGAVSGTPLGMRASDQQHVVVAPRSILRTPHTSAFSLAALMSDDSYSEQQSSSVAVVPPTTGRRITWASSLDHYRRSSPVSFSLASNAAASSSSASESEAVEMEDNHDMESEPEPSSAAPSASSSAILSPLQGTIRSLSPYMQTALSSSSVPSQSSSSSSPSRNLFSPSSSSAASNVLSPLSAVLSPLQQQMAAIAAAYSSPSTSEMTQGARRGVNFAASASDHPGQHPAPSSRFARVSTPAKFGQHMPLEDEEEDGSSSSRSNVPARAGRTRTGRTPRSSRTANRSVDPAPSSSTAPAPATPVAYALRSRVKL